MKWLGAGTGRSGSRFIAAVFDRVGAACTHETHAAWLPETRHPERIRSGEWTAAAPLHWEGFDGPVLWQLRAPAECVASMVGHQTFHPTRGDVQYQQTLCEFGVELCGDPLRDAVTFVGDWWRLLGERADVWWRVEDLTGRRVAGIVDRWVGVSVDAHDAAAAIEACMWRGRSRTRPAEPLPEWAVELRDLSEAYGYSREGHHKGAT